MSTETSAGSLPGSCRGDSGPVFSPSPATVAIEWSGFVPTPQLPQAYNPAERLHRDGEQQHSAARLQDADLVRLVVRLSRVAHPRSPLEPKQFHHRGLSGAAARRPLRAGAPARAVAHLGRTPARESRHARRADARVVELSDVARRRRAAAVRGVGAGDGTTRQRRSSVTAGGRSVRQSRRLRAARGISCGAGGRRVRAAPRLADARRARRSRRRT